MNAVAWASPAAIGEMTLPQLRCLMQAKPPGSPEVVTTMEDYQRAVDRRRAEDARWDDRAVS